MSNNDPIIVGEEIRLDQMTSSACVHRFVQMGNVSSLLVRSSSSSVSPLKCGWSFSALHAVHQSNESCSSGDWFDSLDCHLHSLWIPFNRERTPHSSPDPFIHLRYSSEFLASIVCYPWTCFHLRRLEQTRVHQTSTNGSSWGCEWHLGSFFLLMVMTSSSMRDDPLCRVCLPARKSRKCHKWCVCPPYWSPITRKRMFLCFLSLDHLGRAFIIVEMSSARTAKWSFDCCVASSISLLYSSISLLFSTLSVEDL